jgi:hypothetical protein
MFDLVTGGNLSFTVDQNRIGENIIMSAIRRIGYY